MNKIGITPALKPMVILLGVIAFVAFVAMRFYLGIPMGDPHPREDGTVRAIPMN